MLKSKRPTAALPHSDTLISSNVALMHPVIFEALHGSVIRAAALQTLGRNQLSHFGDTEG